MWISSAEFAEKFGLNVKSLQKSCFRAQKIGKKICSLKSNILVLSFTHGKGGKSGQVLRLWDEPFESESAAVEFLSAESKGLGVDTSPKAQDDKNLGVDTSATPQYDKVVAQGDKIGQYDKKDEKITTLTTFTTLRNLGDLKGLRQGADIMDTSPKAQDDKNLGVDTLATAQQDKVVAQYDKGATQQDKRNQYDKVYQGDKINQQTSAKAQNVALEKMSVVKEWERARTKMSAKDFIASTNAKGDYSLEISENKLYAWQRAYKNGGFNALIDTRGANKKSEIENLGLKELVESLIMASRGRVNVSSIHRLLHAHLASLDRCDMKEFLAKESEVVSYGVLDRYVRSYLRKNPLQKLIIQKGEDGAVSAFLPALGVSNHRVNSINQIVEIDATSIDAIIDTSILARELGLEVESVEQWQKRFVLIGLIDTYSGVCSFHISDTENSLGVSRAIAKYIMKYGKPKIIKSDNGSAFVSRYIKEVLLRLDIQSERTPAYSGWCKPFVERNFARLQNHLTEWLKGYIGHSVAQRQAIEFFFSRAQRRLKRGQKSNQKDLHTLNEIALKIDEYADSFMNNAYLARIEKTPTQAYNERASEAVAMNEYELMSRLSPLERRAVGKKGIAYGGLYFYSTKIYEFASVMVAQNINNTSELFVYDEKGAFIDIARELDSVKGVSAETAKRAQKAFKQRLKNEKAKMSEARAWVESTTPAILSELTKKMPRTQKPKYKGVNNELLESARLKSEALRVSGEYESVLGVVDTSPKAQDDKVKAFVRGQQGEKNYQQKTKKITTLTTFTTLRKNGLLKGVKENLTAKKNLSWESAVLGGEK